MKAFLFASACSVLGLLPLLAGSVTVESEYFTVDTTAKLTVVPTSCNWQQGSITIGWASNYTSANKPTYTVYWANSTNNFESEGFFTDRSNVTEIRAGMLGNSFTDDQYYKRGDGTQIIYYCVKGSDGSKGCCATRRRYGLFLGFNNQGIDPSSRNANELWNQYVLAGGVLNHEDAICRIDNNRQQIHALLAGFASCAKKGDIFVFYVFAHGMQGSLLGNFEGFSLGGGAYYENSLLKDDLDNIGRQGVAVIAILEPCGSGQIATKCGTKNNKAFINAGTWKETAFFTSDTELSQYSGTQYSLFGRAFIDWGWLDGCAGSNGTATYYDLFVYAKKQVAGISYNETREPSALNDKILRHVIAYTGVGKNRRPLLSAPNGLSATTTLEGKIECSWNNVSGADGYILRWKKSDESSFEKYWAISDGCAFTIPNSSYGIPSPSVLCGYDFKVAAYNSAGEGRYSETIRGAAISPTLEKIKSVVKDGIEWFYSEADGGILLFRQTFEPAVSAFELVGAVEPPNSIDGVDVGVIGAYAFYGCDKITTVTVPYTVYSVGERSFEGCNNLATVTFTGEMPSGLNESGLISTSVKIKYPRRYANQYAEVIPAEQFGGYSDAGEYEAATMTLGSEGVFSPTDTDGDGRNDKLIVSTQIETDKGGNYNWSAELATAKGEEIVIATGEIQLSAGVNESAFAFDGADILKSGLAGPYVVKNVIIWNDDDFVRLQGNLMSDEIPMDSWWLKLFVRTDGDDSADGKSLIRAKGTIQAAVDAAEESTIVVVYPGTYSPFTVNDGQLKIVSSEGSTATCIDAAGVTRCATLGSSVGDTNVVLKGFTLRNGNANGKVQMWYGTATRGTYGDTEVLVTGSEQTYGSDRAFVCPYDLDGDGKLELAIGGLDGKFRMFKCAPGGESTESWLTDAVGAPLTVAAGRSTPVLADVNNDGCVDILSGDTSGNVWAFLGNGETWNATAVPVFDNATAKLSDRSRIGYGDANGDGIGDLLVGRTNGSVELAFGVKMESPTFAFRVKGTYTVTFDLGEHGTLKAGELVQSIVEGEPAVAPEITIDDPYFFEGWDVAFDSIVGDMVVRAKYVHRPLSLAEALNAPELTWDVEGEVEWQPEWADDALDGLHQASICGLGNNSSSTVMTKVNGAGKICFAWCSRLASRNTKLQFVLDDSVARMLTGTNDWADASVTISEDGEHTLKWRLITGRSGASSDDFAALDKVAWEPRLPPTLAEALNTNLVWKTDGDALWTGVERDSLLEARESWAQVSDLGDDGTSWIETRVYGSGVLTFDWAVSCEEEYDWLEFTVDGVVYGYLDGQTGWVSDTITISGKGWHNVRWEYVKDIMDDPDLAGANLAMLDNVEWISKDIPATDTPVPVPYPEIERNFKTYLDATNGDYEAAALAVGKNGYAIWECYVAGLDPDNPESKFRITDIKFEDGELKISWSPDLKDARKYTEYGRKEIGGSERWTNMKEVDSAEKNDYKFRKVTVDMP